MIATNAAVVSSLLLLLPHSSIAGDDDAAAGWSRFRGPNGTGIAAGDAALPDALAPQENALWRTELPPGYSSPVVAPSFVVVTCIDGVEATTVCLDRDNGEILWKAVAPKKLDEPHRNVNSPAAPTPVTDGENVWVFIENCGGLIAYDAEGELRWSKDVGPFKTPYGMSTSPMLVGDLVVLQCDHDAGSYLLGLDAATGEERWRVDRPGTTHGFSTPVVYHPEKGNPQLIVSSSYEIAAFDATTGAKIWWVDGTAWQAKTLPIVDGDRVYVSTWMASPAELGAPRLTSSWAEMLEEYDADEDGGLQKGELSELGLERIWFLYDLDGSDALDKDEWGYALRRNTAENGLFAIRLGGRGDVKNSHVLWKWKRSLPNIPSPVVYGGAVWVLKEGGILTTLDPETGETIRSERIEGAEDTYYASLIAGDGKVYAASHAGNVAVIEAVPEWKVLSISEFGEEIWATPAIDGGQVFVRTEDALYAF